MQSDIFVKIDPQLMTLRTGSKSIRTKCSASLRLSQLLKIDFKELY